MADCCGPRGYGRLFDERFARRRAKRYRRRGLDATARRIVELVEEHGVGGASVLEVGGGVGDIQLELLARGAARATNLELSPAYEPEAQRLIDDAGLTGRVERRILDIAANPDEVGAADVVVLNRVVCCYPDYARLLGAVADHARGLVVFSHPSRNLVTRAFIGLQNLIFRIGGSEFRVFAHPPGAMREVLASRGLQVSVGRRALVWQLSAAHR